MYTLHLLLLLLLLYLPINLCKMRKTIKTVKYPFPVAWTPVAHTTIDVGDQEEATACWKYRTFSYNQGFGNTFYLSTQPHLTKDQSEDHFVWGHAIGWKTGMEADNKQAGVAELFISHNNQTRKEEALQHAEKTRYHMNLYEEWQDLFEWQSICYAISIARKSELMYVNGKFIMGYEWPKDFNKGWGDFPLNLQMGTNWRGEVTDLNIYDSAFDEEELIARTTSCQEPEKGGIFAWSPEKYNLTNNDDIETILSEVPASDLCLQDKDQDVLELFDSRVPKSPLQSEQICARLNGQLNLVPVTEEDGFAMLNEIIEYVTKVNISGEIGIYVAGRAFVNATDMMDIKEGYQTYPKGGRWTIKDPYTDTIIGVPFITTPTGATYARVMQECLACIAGYKPETLASFEGKLCKGVGDCAHNFVCASQICDRGDMPWGLMCRFKQKLRLRLKGLFPPFFPHIVFLLGAKKSNHIKLTDDFGFSRMKHLVAINTTS